MPGDQRSCGKLEDGGMPYSRQLGGIATFDRHSHDDIYGCACSAYYILKVMPLDIGKMCLRLPAARSPASVIPTGLARAACRAIATKGRALGGGRPIITAAKTFIGLRPASPAVAAHPWSAQYVSPRLRDILALPDLSVEHVERRRRLQPMLHPVRVANINPILSGVPSYGASRRDAGS